MEIKKVMILISMLSFIILISSCTQKQIDNDILCIKFYKLNKDKNFDVLFNVAIGGRRVTSVYDESSNQYEYIFNTIDIYDYMSDIFFILPLYERDATLTEKDSIFKKVNKEARSYLSKKYKVNSKAELFDSFVKFVENVYIEYDNIETPEGFGFKNVIIEGNPRSGKFITFVLNDQCKVYYLADNCSLTEYWQKYFRKLNKLDDKWYYEVVSK